MFTRGNDDTVRTAIERGLALAETLIDRLPDQARAHHLAPYVAVDTVLLRSCLQTLRGEHHYILCAPFARAPSMKRPRV